MQRSQIAASMLVLALAAPSLAQEADPPADPLAGPAVEIRAVPGVEEAYRPGEVGGIDDADRAVPLQVYLGALRELGETEHPLSEEQAAAVRDELRRYGQELAVFLEAVGPDLRGLIGELPRDQRGRAGAEIAELDRLGQMLDRIDRAGTLTDTDRASRSDRRARAQQRTRDGQRDAAREQGEFRLELRERRARAERRRADAAAPDDMMTDEPMRDEPMTDTTLNADAFGDVRARLVELRNQAPSVAALETRLWGLLTEPQQGVVGASVESYLTDRRDRIQEARLEREIERRQAEAEARQQQRPDRALDLGDATRQRVLAMLQDGEIPERVWVRLPERLRARLESLPEDERADALARLLKSRPDRASDRAADRPDP